MRTYGQYCALARTLDVVGDRWTLLAVRELLGGPKRYSDLIDALPGIGTSLLVDRLRILEENDLVERRQLPPPAGSRVYQLTSAGEDLGEALLPLVLWGARHLLGERRPGETFRAEWPLLALQGMTRRADLTGVSVVAEFRIDDSVANVRIADGRMSVHAGAPPEGPDVTVSTDLDSFVAIGARRSDLGEALAEGVLELDGDPDAARALLALVEAALPHEGVPIRPGQLLDR